MRRTISMPLLAAGILLGSMTTGAYAKDTPAAKPKAAEPAAPKTPATSAATPSRTLLESPLLNAKRENLEVELCSSFFCLVDASQNRKRVFQFRYCTFDISDPGASDVKTYLDAVGNLFVLKAAMSWQDAPSTFICFWSPLEPLSPAYRMADITIPELTRSAMANMDSALTFRDGSHPFGSKTIEDLQSIRISQDVNDEEATQRDIRRLSEEIAKYLNARLLSWTDSLYEIQKSGGERIFEKIKLRPQEVNLAKEVRAMQESGKSGEDYTRKLQRLNRYLLDWLLGNAQSTYTFPYSPPTEYGDPLQPEWIRKAYQGFTHDPFVFWVNINKESVADVKAWIESQGSVNTRPDGKYALTSGKSDDKSAKVLIFDPATGTVEAEKPAAE